MKDFREEFELKFIASDKEQEYNAYPFRMPKVTFDAVEEFIAEEIHAAVQQAKKEVAIEIMNYIQKSFSSQEAIGIVNVLEAKYLPEKKSEEKKYPCRGCGKLRTKAEGGTTFAYCNECWDKKTQV